MSDDIGKICFGWWTGLTAVNKGHMRADLARLKRVGTVAEALAVSASHDLNKRLHVAGYGLQSRPDRLALIALTLAQVKDNAAQPAARKMGQGDPKALSGIRFNALIRATDPADLVAPLRRALRSVGQGANVARLATDLYWWNDAIRARWCFDYYGAHDAAPQTVTPSEETEA